MLTVADAAASTFRVDIEAQDEETFEWVQISSGTAWVVMHGDDSTLLITAGHVCKGDEFRYELVASSGAKYLVTDKHAHEQYDLCLMRTEGVIGPTLWMSDVAPTYDQPVFGVGAPLGVYGCDGGSSLDECGMAPISRGFYAGGNLVSMPMYGGNSGSAVLTADGVIGVLVEGYRQYPMLSFIEPRSHLREFVGL